MAQTKKAPKATAAKAPKTTGTTSNKKFEDLRTKTDDQLERPARIKEVRRAIAQIKTLQTERTRSAAKV